MSFKHPEDYLIGLVQELSHPQPRQGGEELGLPRETEWVEFKENNSDPQDLGEYISALANSAALEGKASAYMVWGIRDSDHAVVGTKFDPRVQKKKNEELENWLLRLLSPRIDFSFSYVTVGDHQVVLLTIPRASRQPVSFQRTKFLRVGSYKKKLSDFPEKERALWRIFDQTTFEEGVAVENIGADDVLRLLDYPAYFDLLEAPLPENRDGILPALESDLLIRRCPAGGWNITNMGAILFAKSLGDFPRLKRKAMRVIHYRGVARTDALKEREGTRGYAAGFEDLINYITGLLPSSEVIDQALRRIVPTFPDLAVRELVANAIIHQDFFVMGAGPMVEVFDDRVEITNPGSPLVDSLRFLDNPPKSRNEALASLMRRFGICEERGSGIDKVVREIERRQLPAPLFEAPGEFTRTVLFSPKSLTEMDKDARVMACYLHACLKYVSREYLTNGSLRERFGVEEKNKASVSRYIKEAVELVPRQSKADG